MNNEQTSAPEAPPSVAITQKLAAVGVFKGFHGLEGLLEANDFWDEQPYGTRLYYGSGGTAYLHRGVLRAAVEILRQPAPESTALTEISDDELAHRFTCITTEVARRLSKANR